MTGLYVHVPFCVSKCAYCDFYSLANRTDLVPQYVDAVLAEARPRAGMSFDTLYLGGGTPSLLGPANLERLIRGLRSNYDLSCLVEATIEVNPDSASEGLLQTAMGLGFTRVSVGVQSLSDRELRSVGRVHTAAQAVEAVLRATGMGFKGVSADVIVGLPGQVPSGASAEESVSTRHQGCAEGQSPFAEGLGVSPNSSTSPQEWGPRGLKETSDAASVGSLRRTLERLIGLGVSHVSAYCLSLEHDTPLALNPPGDLPSDDDQVELFDGARSLLKGKGFDHYEISNFCLPGRECRHNLNYWRGGDYLGLGPAAASHLGGRRWKNRADLAGYLGDPSNVVDDVEELDATEKAAEEAMLRLRLLVEGLAADEIVRRFGEDATLGLFGRLESLAVEGWLTWDGKTYRLAESRVLTSNSVLARVLG